MRAVRYEQYGGPVNIVEVPDPVPPAHGAVIRVEATGVCRSDWHGWQGHDPDTTLPQIPGHEFAGRIVAVGEQVTRWRDGPRVTAPFVCACGSCPMCSRGDQQVCERQTQPGFTHDGSFAELVVVHHADVNLVAVPDGLDPVAAAALGCRFATAFRAVVQQGRPQPGDWLAVHGCGGVGLSAVMVAVATGARVVAVDVSAGALALAAELGAEVCIEATGTADTDVAARARRLGEAVRDATGGGAAVSLDALGSHVTAAASVHSLARRGRHVQVGLLPPALGVPPLPMERVIGYELEIVGTHGMAAHGYPAMLAAVTSGRLDPRRLVGREIGFDDLPDALVAMGQSGRSGITVADLT